jgi:hypothetical protein
LLKKKVGVPFKIARRTVDEYGDEEDTVEIRDWGCSADDKAPGEAHGPVRYIVLCFKLIIIYTKALFGYVRVYERTATSR